jgi:hypothetical protein
LNGYSIKNGIVFVEAGTESIPMKSESLEQFIYEHYYGYTKIDENTEEYKLQHPSWFVNKVVDYKMDCDFKAMYGDAFSVLNTTAAYCRFHSRRFIGRNRVETQPIKF